MEMEIGVGGGHLGLGSGGSARGDVGMGLV